MAHHVQITIPRSSAGCLPSGRSMCVPAPAGRLDAAYGPCSGRPQQPVVLVLDNGPIHTSKASRAALAGRAWASVEWLPKYAPGLNAILARPQAPLSCSPDRLRPRPFDRTVHKAIADMNLERQTRACTNLRTALRTLRAAGRRRMALEMDPTEVGRRPPDSKGQHLKWLRHQH